MTLHVTLRVEKRAVTERYPWCARCERTLYALFPLHTTVRAWVDAHRPYCGSTLKEPLMWAAAYDLGTDRCILVPA